LKPKQIKIEEFVLNYFDFRVDTDIHYEGAGVYSVRLNSASAQQDFYGHDVLSLVFNGEASLDNPDSELITSNHPFLDVIRNNLESTPQQDPKLSEVYIFLQLINQNGEIIIPDLIFNKCTCKTEYQIHYFPTFILKFNILYETDLRSENIFSLCYDATTGKLMPNNFCGYNHTYVTDKRPPGIKQQKTVHLSRIIQSARHEIESRIDKDSKLIAHQINKRFEKDKKRLESHCLSERSKLKIDNIVGHEQLKKQLQKDLNELEDKYACHVSIELLSVLKLWWPVVSYSTILQSARKRFQIDNIQYNFQKNETIFQKCPQCGNRSIFDVCFIGKHVLCSHCGGGVNECGVCHELICSDHGGYCHTCQKIICTDHQIVCKYGSHDEKTFYCPDCIVESFEGKAICKECVVYCDTCNRPFSNDFIKICRSGQEPVCLFHNDNPCGYICEYCKQVTCKTHGVMTFENTWVCQDHANRSTCCDRIFSLSRLERCSVNNNEILCPEHRFHCIECGNTICKDHMNISVKGERLCPSHSETCSLCDEGHNIYNTKDLEFCNYRKTYICEKHRIPCQVCGEQYIGEPYVSNYPTCESCGKFSCGINDCSTQMQVCPLCGQSYCHHCFTSDGNCKTCEILTKTQYSIDTQGQKQKDVFIQYFIQAKDICNDKDKKFIDKLIKNLPYIKFNCKDNETFTVFIFHCSPPKWKVLKTGLSRKMLRIVTENKTIKVQNAFIEPVKSKPKNIQDNNQ